LTAEDAVDNVAYVTLAAARDFLAAVVVFPEESGPSPRQTHVTTPRGLDL
jgi:hypothetical protein